ncbi:MAG: 1,2-phenylacetyl-CoA epoxidase subunit PaaD [Sphingobium sp.]
MEIASALDTDLTARICAVLDTVPDPEIPVVSVTELGIVRGIVPDETGAPTVQITPTYTGCPATAMIERSVRDALDMAGFHDVALKTVLSPAWSTDMISVDGREKLRAYGIAPPPEGVASHSLRGRDIVECPRCSSTDTREVSRFGSTPCKALWQCNSCAEPFDRFKCH